MLLRGRGNMQNGIFVNDADEVTVDGFMARDYKANGFFFTNLNGYTMNHLIARQTGVYGLYAFNTIGGRMLNSEAYYVNDGAFYIGQTPPQAKPIRTIVAQRRRLGQPARLQRHQHALRDDHQEPLLQQRARHRARTRWTREKFPPAEDNVIIDNDIFWNNFNFHAGQPAVRGARGPAPRRSSPVGTGILLLGGRGNRIENNRIYGNYLAGVAAIEGILLEKTPEARATCSDNIVRNNQFGLGGTDVNGRDIMLRRQRQRQLLLDGRRHARRSPPTARRSPAAAAPNAFSQSVAEHDARLDRRERAERLEQAPAPRQAGLHAARGLQGEAVLIVAASPASRSSARRRRTARAKKTIDARRQLLRAARRDGEARHHGHLEVARLRGGRRRPRRQAQVRPQGRQEVPLRGRLDGLLLQAQADGARAPTSSSARSTRRCA